ncbi:MAG TPA: diacylglycerol kinase family protein [Acidimicrobiia bacterium]|nr:diacylglycerol kinase family protein [Acidimicrobiia bacterium]
MPKWHVYVNRAAGRKAYEPGLIRDLLGELGLDFDLQVPDSPEQMKGLLEDAAMAGATHFAMAGGDGTVNVAVNALMPLGLAAPPVIAVLPVGTGCDLLRTFGLPQDVAGAARHLTGDDTYDIDVGTLEGTWGLRYFVNVAQTGVGAAAAQTATSLGRRLGTARYPLAFMARLPGFPRAKVKITTERRIIESEALAVILANAQFFAGGWNVAPKAMLVDGALDVQIINCRKTYAPALVPKVIKGTHLSDPAVRRLSAAEFTIETDPPWPIECDGDLVGNTAVRGRVIPAAISLKI